MGTKSRHHVNARRNAHGRAITEKRVKEMERTNKRAPVITYNISITADTVNLELPQEPRKDNFEVYRPQKGRKPKFEYLDDPKNPGGNRKNRK